jgi:hypothetical protein
MVTRSNYEMEDEPTRRPLNTGFLDHQTLEQRAAHTEHPPLKGLSNHLSFVIAGLCPGDPVFLLGLDARDKPAHDESVIQPDRKPL